MTHPIALSTTDLDELHRRVVERTLRWRHYTWYWGDAINVDGLLAAESVAPGIAGTLAAQLEAWAETAPDSFDDVLAPGLAIVTLAERGLVGTAAVDRFLASVDRVPTLACGLPSLEPQRLAFRFGFCIDALYHLPPALAALGAWRGQPERVAEAVAMMERGLDVLRCAGGWSQWYDDTVERNNRIPWSRGVGWALLGVVDLLVQLDRVPGRHDAAVSSFEATAREMLDRLVQTQQDDGNWAAVLGDELAKPETSTAAFFVTAAAHPRVRSFWRSPDDVLDRAVGAVVSAVGPDGIVEGVSADILPSFEIAGYREFRCEPSPWAQGPVLRALSVLRDGQAR